MNRDTLHRIHRLAGIKSDIINESFNRFKNIKKLLKENINELKEEVVLWHGSPYEFKKFSSQKIGTGEGAQAFGWGLYFTDSKDIAKHYANVLSTKEKITKDDIVTKIPENKYIQKELKLIAERGTNAYIQEIFDTYSKSAERGNKESIEVIDFFKTHKIGFKDNNNNRFQNIGNKEELVVIKPNRILYKVTLHKGKTPDQYTWLEWDKIPAKKQIETIIEALEKDDFYKKRIEEYGYDYKKIKEADSGYGGKDVYESLSAIVGGDKQASLFLLRAGIDGIKYPAESIAKGKTWDNAEAFNYVVFDENAITIEKQDMFEENNINEKWSLKYKRSIDCKHPKGFSQKAHCKGRLKEEEINEPKELIKKAHDSITRIKGKDYAPNVHEIQKWIDKYKK